MKKLFVSLMIVFLVLTVAFGSAVNVKADDGDPTSPVDQPNDGPTVFTAPGDDEAYMYPWDAPDQAEPVEPNQPVDHDDGPITYSEPTVSYELVLEPASVNLITAVNDFCEEQLQLDPMMNNVVGCW